MTGNKMEAISWLTSGFYYTACLAEKNKVKIQTLSS